MDFDFTAETEPIIPEVLAGPNLTDLKSMTRKQFTQGILNVYQRLGGDLWLLEQAQIDPRSFLEMLKKLIPTNVNLDQIDGFQITLIDRYGSQVKIERERSSSAEQTTTDVPRTPDSDPNASGVRPLDGPEVNITETFGPSTKFSDSEATLPGLLPGNSPVKAVKDPDEDTFDFTL